MKYYDVVYRSPLSSVGIHRCVPAKSHKEAGKKSSILLCSGTKWLPEQFIILKVTESEYHPMETKDV